VTSLAVAIADARPGHVCLSPRAYILPGDRRAAIERPIRG
jgi:hypothetical protein